ncbi:hypothetical protein L596_028691 [Steinernema carpocapsae]|uniref:Uncharacterized protein n=1 Tax=Steinernema carpocapsae TaxID=34508 RepID=A0A4U5LZ58_STECR|nr:hypothetical protein L596_028691 [Steinernema carpocapsae]
MQNKPARGASKGCVDREEDEEEKEDSKEGEALGHTRAWDVSQESDLYEIYGGSRLFPRWRDDRFGFWKRRFRRNGF